MAGENDISIVIKAVLNDSSVVNIKTQLDELVKKYSNQVIKINIDSDVIKTLQGFTASMEKFQAATDAQKKTVEQFIDVTKKLDGSTITVTKSINALGEIVTKTRTSHDETSKAVEKEAVSYEHLAQKIKIADKSLLDSISTNRNAQNIPTNVNVKSSQGYTSTTTRLQGDGETLIGTTVTENYKKQRQDELKAQAEHLAATRKNLLQEENEWKSFVSTQQQSYDKYITTTGKGLLQEDKEFSDFVAKQELNFNKLNATTNKSLLQEENEWKSFVSAQEASYQKYLATQTKQEIAQSKLGSVVSPASKSNLNFQEAQNYAKSLAGVDAELRSVGYSINAAGEKLQTLNIQTKEGGKYQKDWTATLNQATGQTHLFEKGLSDVAQRQLGIAEKFKTMAQSIPLWMIGMTGFMSTLHFFTEGIKYVNDFNATLTQISTAVNYNQAKVNELGKTYQALGVQMGATSKEVAAGALEFYRQGLGDEEVLKRLTLTTEYAKISGLEFKQSAELLTAASTSMHTDITKVADVFTQLGDKTATSASEIAIGFQKVGSTADALKIPFEKVAAIVATISSVTREAPETIGSAVKSILSRIGSVKEKGYDSEDGTTINQVSKALDAANIKLTDAKGNFRDFNTVLDELGTQWKNIDDKTQRYIATTVAGTYQQSRFLALMANYNKVLDLNQVALNSAGTTQQKYNLYLEGTQSHIDRLKARLETLWGDTFKSDGIKSIIDTLGSLLSGVTAVVNTFGLMPPVVFAATTAIILFRNSSATLASSTLGMLGTSLASVRASVLAYTGSTVAARVATIALQASVTLGLSLAIAGLVSIISSAVSHHQKLAEQQRQLEAQNKQVTDSWTNQRDLVKSLVSEYDKLDGTKNRTVDQDKRYLEISGQLSTLMPNLIASIDAKGIAHLKSADAVAKELGYAEKLTKLENEKALTSSKKDFGNDISDLSDAQSRLDRINNQIKYKNNYGADGNKVTDALSEDQIKSLEIQALGLESQINGSVDSMKGRVLSLSTTVATLAGVKVGDSLSVELKKITDSLDVKSMSPSELAAKSMAIGGIISTLDKLKNASSMGEAQALDKSLLDQAKAAGISAVALKGLYDSFFKGNSIVPEATKQTVDYGDSLKKLDEDLTEAEKSTKTLASAYQQLQNGEQLSVDETLKLVAAHPQLLDYLLQHNGLITDKGAILQQVANIERRVRLDEAQNLLDGVTDTRNALEIKREMYKQFYSALSPLIAAPFTTIGQMPSFGGAKSDNGLSEQEKKSLADAEKQQKQFQLRVELLSKPIDLKTYGVKPTKPKDTTSAAAAIDAKADGIQKLDLTNQQIKAIQQQREATVDLNTQLDKKITASEKEKNYHQAIEYTNQLLVNQKKLLTEITTANNSIHGKAENLRKGMSSDPRNQFGLKSSDLNSWFDANGQASSAYDAIQNKIKQQSADVQNGNMSNAAKKKQLDYLSEEQKYVTDLFNSLSKLKDAYKANGDEAQKITDALSTGQSKIVDDNIKAQDASLVPFTNNIKKLKTEMSSLKTDPATKIKDQIELIKAYDDEEKAIKKYNKELEASNLTLNKNSDAFAKNKDQIDKNKAAIEQLIADQEAEKMKIATETIDVIKKGIQTQIDEEKNRHSQKIKDLDDEMKKQDDATNAVIQGIDRIQQANDAAKTLEKDQKEAQLIQNEINAYSLDNSNEGKSKVIELKEKLATVTEKIEDEQAKRSNELVKQSLQDSNKAYKTDIDNKKDAEDKKSQIITDALDNRLKDDTHWLELETQLINGHTEGIQTEMKGLITDLGKFATDNMKTAGVHIANLQSAIDKLKASAAQVSNLSPTPNSSGGYTPPTPNGSGGSSTPTPPTSLPNDKGQPVIQPTSTDADKIAQMKKNSADWITDVTNRAYYARENAQLGAQLGATYDSKTGKWAKNGVPLFDTGGGFTGSFSGVKLAGLHEKELVLNKLDTSNILKAVDFTRNFMSNIKLPDFSNIIPKMGSSVGNNVNLNLGGITIQGTQSGADSALNTIVNGLKRMGVNINQ